MALVPAPTHNGVILTYRRCYEVGNGRKVVQEGDGFGIVVDTAPEPCEDSDAGWWVVRFPDDRLVFVEVDDATGLEAF